MSWPDLIAYYFRAAPYLAATIPIIAALPSVVPPIIQAARAAGSGVAAGAGRVRRGLSAIAAGFAAFQRQPAAAAVETRLGLSADDIALLSSLAGRVPDLLALLTAPPFAIANAPVQISPLPAAPAPAAAGQPPAQTAQDIPPASPLPPGAEPWPRPVRPGAGIRL